MKPSRRRRNGQRMEHQRIASARRPAPSARAIADEMPPPMAPADSICTIITSTFGAASRSSVLVIDLE